MEKITYRSAKLRLIATATIHEDNTWSLTIMKDRKNAKEYPIADNLSHIECIELIKLMKVVESPYIHDAVDIMKKNAEHVYKVREGMGHIFVYEEPEGDQD